MAKRKINNTHALLLAGLALSGCVGPVDGMSEGDDQAQTEAEADELDTGFNRKLPPFGGNGLDALYTRLSGGTETYKNVLTNNVYSQGGISEAGDAFMGYLAKCAAPSGQSITFLAGSSSSTLTPRSRPGELGFGTLEGQGVDNGNPFNATNYNSAVYTQALTACLGAHLNGNAASVEIQMANAQRGAFDGTMSTYEGAFFGDIFNGAKTLYHCRLPSSPVGAIRACNYASGSADINCPYVDAGLCSDVCTGGNNQAGTAVTCTVGGVAYKPLFTAYNRSANNVALNKTATQISTAGGTWVASASRAVDGNTNGLLASQTITLTLVADKPWWAVDLGSDFNIRGVTLYNRTDGTAAELARLSNFDVNVKNAAGTVIATTYHPGTVSGNVSLTINATGARSVQVKRRTNGAQLAISEVQVWRQ